LGYVAASKHVHGSVWHMGSHLIAYASIAYVSRTRINIAATIFSMGLIGVWVLHWANLKLVMSLASLALLPLAWYAMRQIVRCHRGIEVYYLPEKSSDREGFYVRGATLAGQRAVALWACDAVGLLSSWAFFLCVFVAGFNSA
jgi:hypothetical protein